MSAAKTIHLSDYSLVGKDTALAVEKGLAEATWYASPVPKEKMRELLQRRDGPAIRDTILWFALIIGSGWAGYQLWQAGSWWAVVPFMIYGVLYGSTSDSRWHESGHGTAFKTDWMNNAALRDRLLHGHARIHALALEPHPAPQRHHHRRARSGNRRPAPAEHPDPDPEFLRPQSSSRCIFGMSCSTARAG